LAKNGTRQTLPGLELPAPLGAEIFLRSGNIRRLVECYKSLV